MVNLKRVGLANYELTGFMIVGFFALLGLALITVPDLNPSNTIELNAPDEVSLQIRMPHASFSAVSSQEKLFSNNPQTVLFSNPATGESFHCQINCQNK